MTYLLDGYSSLQHHDAAPLGPADLPRKKPAEAQRNATTETGNRGAWLQRQVHGISHDALTLTILLLENHQNAPYAESGENHHQNPK